MQKTKARPYDREDLSVKDNKKDKYRRKVYKNPFDARKASDDEDRQNLKEIRAVEAKQMLTGGQAKIAAKAPPPNKIDAKDFAVLKAEKAKGRGMGLQDEKVKPGKVMKAALGVLALGKKMKDEGKPMPLGMAAAMFNKKKMKEILGRSKGGDMGLQDESVKPGKVMKARVGKSIDAKKFMKTIGVFPKVSSSASNINSKSLHKNLMKSKNPYSDLVKTTAKGPKNYISRGGKSVTRIPLAGKATSVGSTTMKGMKFSDKAKMVDAGKINKATGKFTSMEALRESIGYRPGESTDKFNKRRMALAAAKKAAKANKYGKVALGVAAAGTAAIQYLKSKMNKKKDNVKKKMGGGLMQRPMGYKHGSEPGAGLLGGTGIPKESGKRSARDIQRGKKRENSFTIRFPKKEGPANKETTIKEYKFKNIGKTMSRMSGGMMQKPMGYRSGTMIKARGCKLGRTRPTKIT